MKTILAKNLALLVFLGTISCWSQTQPFFNATAGNGNGYRFWGGNNNYKIHMGNTSLYRYGPVQDYSIKTNMSAGTPDRGWTWGVVNQQPIAALNSLGVFQLAGNFYAMDKVGVGTTNPSSLLHVVSQTGQTESLAYFQVADATSDYLQIANATGSSGQFIPLIKGYHDTDNRYSLAMIGQTNAANDNGGHPVVYFSARQTSGPIVTRPLFEWNNYTTKMMTMLANGNLGVGTSSPNAKLSLYVPRATSTYPTSTSKGDVLQSLTSDNNSLEFGNGRSQNDRKAWILARHSSNTYGQYYSSLHLQPDVGDKSQYRGVAIGYSAATPVTVGTHLAVNGRVGIGTTNPDAELAVNGNIHAKEVKVDLIGWPDYVFNVNYNLPTLEAVEKHIKENGHLKNIPSAKEVEENGIRLGEMNKLLLEKIEELTLYTIEQDKKLIEQEKRLSIIEQLIKSN